MGHCFRWLSEFTLPLSGVSLRRPVFLSNQPYFVGNRKGFREDDFLECLIKTCIEQNWTTLRVCAQQFLHLGVIIDIQYCAKSNYLSYLI